MPATTPTTDATRADDDAIRQVIAASVAAQSDVESFIPLHTEAVAVVNFGGRRVLGRDALRQAMEQALATPFAQVFTTVDIEDIRYLRPDVALASGTKHIADEREDPDPSLAATGSVTFTLLEDEGRWRIAAAQTTPVAT